MLRHALRMAAVATFGLSLILQEGVRATFGATPKRILDPIGMTVPIMEFDYPVYRLFAAAVAPSAFLRELDFTNIGHLRCCARVARLGGRSRDHRPRRKSGGPAVCVCFCLASVVFGVPNGVTRRRRPRPWW